MKKNKKTSRKPTLKSAVRTFFIIFIPCALFLGIILAVFYNNELKAEKKVIEDQVIQTIDLQKSVIVRDFDSVLSDLLYLSEARELRGLVEGVSFKEPVAYDYLSFSKRKRIYDQIRFLDQAGMEIVRVNFGKFRPYIVSDGELQNKADRYYFTETIKLMREEVYVSPFDLNMEEGEIEKPLKPVIRFGTPVFDRNNEKRGIVLLNYLGADLINDVKRMDADSIGKTMLLNSEGSWFISPETEDEWGFMYKDGKDKTFGNRFPKIWKKMSVEGSGQIYNSDGLFIFSSVYPLLGSLGVRSGLKDFSEEIPAWAGAKAYAWKIVSYIPKKELKAALRKTSTKYFQLFLVLIAFSAFLSLIIVISKMKRLHLHDLLEKMHIG